MLKERCTIDNMAHGKYGDEQMTSLDRSDRRVNSKQLDCSPIPHLSMLDIHSHLDLLKPLVLLRRQSTWLLRQRALEVAMTSC